MEKKNYLILLLAALTILLFIAPQASAGDHRGKGIFFAFPPPPPIPPFIGVTVSPHSQDRDHRQPPRYREDRGGHWEWTKVWIPGTTKRVWVRGHYGRRGHWIPGHWERRHHPGYWERQRVWVPDNHRRAGRHHR
ncbi:hypothetical protein ACFL2O_09865 [Thermodesulfobacteriota bacterium]